jgi:AraC family transcriptional regulator
LMGCVSLLLENPEKAPALFVDHIALALQAHLLGTYSATSVGHPSIRGGLAPWQERRAKDVMIASFGENVSLAQLAMDCGLSRGHFARAFKQTTGRSPHRWMLERRIETAQDLLRNSGRSLKDIAAMCGFSDQSHLTRAFGCTVGTSPGSWRRACC